LCSGESNPRRFLCLDDDINGLQQPSVDRSKCNKGLHEKDEGKKMMII